MITAQFNSTNASICLPASSPSLVALVVVAHARRQTLERADPSLVGVQVAHAIQLASVHAFHVSIGISAALVALGGLIGLVAVAAALGRPLRGKRRARVGRSRANQWKRRVVRPPERAAAAGGLTARRSRWWELASAGIRRRLEVKAPSLAASARRRDFVAGRRFVRSPASPLSNEHAR